MSSSKSKKTGLGKGIDGLFESQTKPKATTKPEAPKEESEIIVAGIPLQLKISEIKPNPQQPRELFSTKEIDILADSIRAKGILEPLIVRKTADGYELIAGQRRLIAAKKAELKEVPVIIKEVVENDREMLELALVENILREDLNPIEEAKAFQKLIEEFDKIDMDIAKLFGKDRSTIINSIRLLDLPNEIIEDISFKRMTPGHGRAILSINNKDLWLEARSTIISRHLTVRQAEILAKKLNKGERPKDQEKETQSAYYESLEQAFSDSLNGLKVKIKHNGKTKKIEIFYKTIEEVEDIMKLLEVKQP
jgi:ParB family chromosome partitioning protein